MTDKRRQFEPDITGMSISAVEIAGKMKVGWNIGNT